MNRISLWLGCATLLAGAVSIPGFAQTQQVTVVGGTATCSGSPNMTVDPAGNLNFTNCTLNTGAPTTAPVCTLANVAATTNVPATISVSCIPAATSYVWAGSVAPAAGFPTNSGTISVTFTTAGSYQYAVQGTNSIGTGNTASNTVTVTDPGQGGNCASFPAAASTTVWATTGQQNSTVTFVAEGYATFKLPLFTSASSALGTIGLRAFSAVNYIVPGKTSDGNTLRTTFAVSTCPGDFTSSAIPAKCTATGTPENQAIQLLFKPYATTTGYCTLVPGTQYYLNVKYLNCAAGTNCTEIVKMN